MTRERDKGRVRLAKGSVADAIGKIIGEPAVAQPDVRASEAPARKPRDRIAKDGRD